MLRLWAVLFQIYLQFGIRRQGVLRTPQRALGKATVFSVVSKIVRADAMRWNFTWMKSTSLLLAVLNVREILTRAQTYFPLLPL